MSTAKKLLTGKKVTRSKSKFSAIKSKENGRKSKLFFENVIQKNKKSKMKNPFSNAAKKPNISPFKDVTNKNSTGLKFYSC